MLLCHQTAALNLPKAVPHCDVHGAITASGLTPLSLTLGVNLKINLESADSYVY